MPPSNYGASSTHFETRVLNVEQTYATLRGDVDKLTQQFNELSSSVDKLKKGGWPVNVGPFQDIDGSDQAAVDFEKELDELSRGVHRSLDGIDEAVKGSSKGSRQAETSLHGQNMENGSFAVASPNSRLVTDGPVDMAIRPRPELSPPLSPIAEAQTKSQVPGNPMQIWRPHFLTTLKPFSSSAIPGADMVTFHPEFLDSQLGGTDWSPGLRFIHNDPTCMLKNRTYYLLDPAVEPFVPSKPGDHGAKLTAFFNVSPEEHYGDLPEGATSYADVPMFILINGRYTYFGNYTQSRWSDKLDHDTQTRHVPANIKKFWASELTSSVRQDWVTQEVKKHFFKKPEYEGRVYAALTDDATVSENDEIKHQERMMKDVKSYVDELREWEREASMKTAMIKPQFILDAFDAADADDPPALRLWWEYLECVDWRKDFYDLLVTLQSRDAQRYLK